MENRIIKRLENILGKESLDISSTSLLKHAENTIGISKRILGVVYPKTRKQVQAIIKLACEYNLKIHPISRGRNLGYGEKLPPQDNCLLLDLSRMNAIKDFNYLTGKV